MKAMTSSTDEKRRASARQPWKDGQACEDRQSPNRQSSQDRNARLAEALKANLARRKAQSRGRAARKDESGGKS
jgi:hypothetical protein